MTFGKLLILPKSINLIKTTKDVFRLNIHSSPLVPVEIQFENYAITIEIELISF